MSIGEERNTVSIKNHPVNPWMDADEKPSGSDGGITVSKPITVCHVALPGDPTRQLFPKR